MNNPAAPLLRSSADRNTLTKWALSATAPYQPVAKVGIQGSTQRGPMYYTRTYGDGYDP